MKKRTKIISCIGAAVLVSGAAVFGVRYYQYSKNVIDVMPVELLNSDWGMSEEGSSGTVTNSMSQEIASDEEKTVKKIYVKEGQSVKIGDKLLAYDMAEKKLDLELKEYDVKELEFAIQRDEKELANLKKGIVTSSADSQGSAARKDPLLASLFLRSEEVAEDESEAETESEAKDESEAETESKTKDKSETKDETETESEAKDESEAETESEAKDKSETKDETETESETETETRAATFSEDSTEDGTTATEDSEENTTTTAEEPDTTTATEEATTEKPDSTYKATVYSTLTYSSKAYRGDGTSDSPYRYLCTSDCIIKGSFINKIRGYNSDGSEKVRESFVAILEVREGNKTSGSLTESLTLYGSQETKKNPGSSWKLSSYTSGEEEDSTTSTSAGASSSTSKTSTSTSSTSTYSGTTSSGSSTTSSSAAYTQQEINEMITEKEQELEERKLDLKEAQLEYDTMKKEVDDGTVKAMINGIVKEVNDPDDAAVDGSSIVTVSSEGNLYVRGAVDEFGYNSLQEGAAITAQSWETGNDFEAKVTEISPYPVSNSSYYNDGTGNPNVSYYPFTAIIEDPPEDLSSGESVTINFDRSQQAQEEGSIYLPLALVRTEGGQSYVYIRDEEKKLKKQYVTTGQTLYNAFIEIKGGLKLSDNVAFPYGKNVKEGAKTKINENVEDVLY